MTRDEARQWAAQAWCKPATETRVMDVALCEAFAEILEKRVNETFDYAELTKARRTIAKKMLEDDGLRMAYESSIAMLLHDKYGMTDDEERNKAARDIINLVFFQ